MSNPNLTDDDIKLLNVLIISEIARRKQTDRNNNTNRNAGRINQLEWIYRTLNHSYGPADYTDHHGHAITAEQLHAQLFAAVRGREPRSTAYKNGALAKIQLVAGEITTAINPYTPGTSSSDAWYAGAAEGHHIAKQAQANETNNPTASD